MLHEALRVILGEHVVQKGSLVNPSYLRFDFTHFSGIGKSDLLKIEKYVNAKILKNIPLEEHVNLPLSKVKDLDVIMLFGEKYEDVVRMIQFDTSKELCGGTHVNATGQIGLFKILSEGSISSGVRRIEAITGESALDYLNKEVELDEIGSLVKNKDLKTGVLQLITSKKELESKLVALKKANSGNVKQKLLNSVISVNGIKCIAKEVEMDAQDMKHISFELRKEENLVVVLAAKLSDKALLSVMITDDLVSNGMSAVEIIKELAKEINGGWRASIFATAEGTEVNGLNRALNKVKEIIG